MTTNRFFPRFRFITAITNEQFALITFSDLHDYVLSEIVSFRVTKPYGMSEINQKQSKVIEVGDFTIRVEIDTTDFTPFIFPVSGQNTPPVCVPVGSGIVLNSPFLVYTILNDAFDNVRIS